MKENVGKEMMIDLIDREKLLDELGVYPTDMSDDDYDFVERLINSQQTIIPINHAHLNHAHWIVVGGDLGYVDCKCSACGYTNCFNDERELYRYCPYCGCKMDEDVDINE